MSDDKDRRERQLRATFKSGGIVKDVRRVLDIEARINHLRKELAARKFYIYDHVRSMTGCNVDASVTTVVVRNHDKAFLVHVDNRAGCNVTQGLDEFVHVVTVPIIEDLS